MGSFEIAGGWLVEKIAPALGGLFGGLSLAMFWTPEKLREKGKVASVFLAGGISAMSGFALTGFVAINLGINQEKVDLVIGLSWCLGLSSVAFMNWISNFISKRQNLDILEVANEIKSSTRSTQVRKTSSPKTKVAQTKAARTKTTRKIVKK
jgi:hypothetical protein